MTNLLERLKSVTCNGAPNTASCSCHWGLLVEAAAEIERLQSLAESLADDLHAEIVNNPSREI